MPTFHRITSGGTRGRDAWGSGAFGAGRGARSHRGLDIVAKPGETVLSPIDGAVIREARPYVKDARYTGLLIEGSGEWTGYEIKMFYVKGTRSGKVKAGEPVGTAQDLGTKYRGITNHVHVEVRRKGVVMDPASLFGASF